MKTLFKKIGLIFLFLAFLAWFLVATYLAVKDEWAELAKWVAKVITGLGLGALFGGAVEVFKWKWNKISNESQD